MHLQVRSVPATSPANLEAFLKVLKQAGLNIEAAGGGDIENGGEFAFAVGEDRVDEAKAALEAAGYHPRIVEVDFRWLSNAPGQLHAFVVAGGGHECHEGSSDQGPHDRGAEPAATDPGPDLLRRGVGGARSGPEPSQLRGPGAARSSPRTPLARVALPSRT